MGSTMGPTAGPRYTYHECLRAFRRFKPVRKLAPFFVAAVALALTGCPSNNQVMLPLPGAIPGTLFVSNDTNLSGVVTFYKLPLTSASTPAGSFTVPLASPDLVGICTDSSGRLFVPDFHNKKVYVYTQPITNGATPAFTLTIGGTAGVEDCAVDSTGNLYVVSNSDSKMYEFTAPVQSGSAVSRSVTSGMVTPFGVGTDASGNVYVSQSSNNTAYSSYGAGNTLFATFGTNAADWGEIVGPDTRAYVANGTTLGDIDVFTTPVANAQTRSSHFTVPGTSSQAVVYMKFDSSGNLYVTARTGITGSELVVLAPPFTGAPLATLTSSNTDALYGVAIGP